MRIMDTSEKLKLILEVNEEIKKTGEQILHPCLVGVSGVGKSSIVRQIFPQVKIVDLSLLLTEEVGGLPRIDTRQGITRYFLPEWTTSDVIFFEEIDKVSNDKISPLLSLLTNFELHGRDMSNKTFIFACQPEWLADNDFNDTLEAFVYRLLFIPVTSLEAFKFEANRLGIKLPVNIEKLVSSKERKMLEFRINMNPRVMGYIGRFIKVCIVKFQGKDTTKLIEEMKKLVTDIFWYIEPKVFVEEMVEQIITKARDIVEMDEEEIKILLENMSVAEKIEILPKVHHKLDSDTFFNHFVEVYYNTSVDERKVLFQNLWNNVRDSITSDKPEKVFWNGIATTFALAIATQVEDDRFKVLVKEFHKRNLKIVHRIRELLKKLGAEDKLDEIIGK